MYIINLIGWIFIWIAVDYKRINPIKLFSKDCIVIFILLLIGVMFTWIK